MDYIISRGCLTMATIYLLGVLIVAGYIFATECHYVFSFYHLFVCLAAGSMWPLIAFMFVVAFLGDWFHGNK